MSHREGPLSSWPKPKHTGAVSVTPAPSCPWSLRVQEHQTCLDTVGKTTSSQTPLQYSERIQAKSAGPCLCR